MSTLQEQRQKYIDDHFEDAYSLLPFLGYEPKTSINQFDFPEVKERKPYQAPKNFGEAYQLYRNTMRKFRR